MNWFDVIAIIILMRTGYMGFKNGLSGELFKIAGLIVSWLAAFYFYESLGAIISFYSLNILTPTHTESISFVLIFIAGFFIFRLLTILFQRMVRMIFMERVDTIAGVLCGLLRGFIIICIVFMLFIEVSSEAIRDSVKNKSFSGPYISKINDRIYIFIQQVDSFKKVRQG